MVRKHNKKTRKSSLRHKTRRSKTHRSKTHRSKTRRSKTYRKRISGGSYEADVTTRTFEGVPTKPLNKFVVTMPGRGIMTAAAYSKLMEDIDRNGNDYYD
jgi:hypothetical protein